MKTRNISHIILVTFTALTMTSCMFNIPPATQAPIIIPVTGGVSGEVKDPAPINVTVNVPDSKPVEAINLEPDEEPVPKTKKELKQDIKDLKREYKQDRKDLKREKRHADRK